MVARSSMRPRIAVHVIWICTACTGNGVSRSSVRQTGAEAGRTSIAVSQMKAEASTGADMAGCEVITTPRFDQPLELVREYVRRDSLGDFITPGPRLFELFACPGHLGGGDQILDATDARIAELPPRSDTAEFLITYRRWGAVFSDSTGVTTLFKSDSGTDSVTVGAVHTPWGWRFPYDVADPHLPPRVLLERVRGAWEPGSRDSLAALAERLARH